MNYKLIINRLGKLLIIEAAALSFSLFVSMIYSQDDSDAFLFSTVITLATGVLMSFVTPEKQEIYSRDGFALVGLGWVLVSLFGAGPYIFSGVLPSFSDALFESVSGFSTTGASVIADVSAVPNGVIFWRSLTNWMGGMGFLVLMIALLSERGAAFHIMKAESPGPAPDKFIPKIGEVAKVLYAIYSAMTVLEILALLAGGMDVFDAVVHSFSTASTGGFSNKVLSVGEYANPYFEIVITFFMLAFAVNFSLYYPLLKGSFKQFLRDEEFKLFISTVAIAIILIAIDLLPLYSPGEAARLSAFQVATAVSTTGFSSADFNLWPGFSQAILVFLMFWGGCAGSTSGGIKYLRFALLAKHARKEAGKIIHPRSVNPVKLNGKLIPDEMLSGMSAFFFLYFIILGGAALVVSLDGYDLISTVTAVIASISNIGPGLGFCGPMGNYAGFSDLSKVVLSSCMIIGRLEIFPVILLLVPSFWKKVNI
jgi:trk system potassium uptake protein TrkH